MSTPTEPTPSQPTYRVPSGPGALRASDGDRQQVADVLSSAYAEGRLTREEHDERLDQAMSAKTFDELIPVTRDLVYADPVPPPAVTPAPSGATVDTAGGHSDPDHMVAVFSGVNRTGRWRVRRQTQAFALFGGIDLDLREAVLEAPEVEISGAWCFGGLDIKVPEGMEVRDQTVGIFGGSDVSHVAPPAPGAPVLVIKGLALFGGVSVKSVRPPGQTGWSRGDARADRYERRMQREQRRYEQRMHRG